MVAVVLTVFGLPAPPAPARSVPSCGRRDRPEPALQGQVTQSARLDGSAAAGYSCNLTLIGDVPSTSQATFDTYRNCAYYSDNVSALTDSGVVVIDASNPSHPKRTAFLTARAMRWAGESLRVNQP